MYLQTSDHNISWSDVMTLLHTAGLSTYIPQKHEIAFKNSSRIAFLMEDQKVMGCGRMISDGAYQAALYDLAVDPSCQGKGWGRKLMETLLKGVEDFNIILYAAPGKDRFYEKFGFQKALSAMIRFVNPERMKRLGHI